MLRNFLLVSSLALSFACGDDTPTFLTTPDVADSGVADTAEVDAPEDADAAPEADTTVDPDTPDFDTGVEPDASETADTPAEPDATPDTAPDAEPDVPVEVRQLGVLVIAPSVESPAAIAMAMGSAIDAHPHYELREARAIAYEDDGLLGFAYRWTERDTRLAPLAEGWDIVVLIDGEPMPFWSAGAHFEGARVLAEFAIEGGAQPVLATNGGGEITSRSYRVGNGLGIPVLPVQDVLAESGAAQSQAPAVIAAALLNELTAVPGGPPEGTDADSWEGLLSAAARVRADETPRYEGPWRGAVRIDPLALPDTYNFMIAGTSSERGWRTHMTQLLEREGVAQSSVSLGQCTMYRSVDQACAELAAPHFAEREYMTLYARAYDVNVSALQDLGATNIQAQIYDRHWDATANDGTDALDQIEDRTLWVPGVATDQGLTWLPQHINFARLKYESSAASLLTDGVHATTAVQDGLAAMSFVSRTGLSPSTEGVSEESAIAIRNGERVIRQLSALSKSGDFVPDVPAERPSLR